MTNAIVINNQNLQIKEYNNIKILTFDDTDRLHNRTRGTSGRNFRTNKNILY